MSIAVRESQEDLWATALRAKGPVVVEWLEARHALDRLPFVDTPERTFAQRVRRWRLGAKASVFDVDDVVTRLGFHLRDVPEEAYIPRSRS